MIPAIAAGRRISVRAVVWQLVALSALAAGWWLAQGAVWALAAALGGLAVVLGGWLLGLVALGGGVNASLGVLARMLAGVVLKWVVVIGVMVAGVGVGLPPLPLLSGVIAALLTQMLAMIGRQYASKA